MSEIDLKEYGKLLQSVETLTQCVRDLTAEVDSLSVKVQELTDLRNSGKGIIMGLMIAGGSVGALAHKFFEVIFK